MSMKATQNVRQDADEVLTPREAAAYIKASDRWLRDQPIPRVKVGRLVRYRRADLDKFLAANLSSVEEK